MVIAQRAPRVVALTRDAALVNPAKEKSRTALVALAVNRATNAILLGYLTKIALICVWVVELSALKSTVVTT